MSESTPSTGIAVNEQLTYQPDTGQSAAIMARLASRINTLEERIAELSRRETSPTSVTAVANTVVLRDGTGAISGLTVTSAQVSDATAAATANRIVLRDGSANFAAGTITAALTGNVTGNVTGTLTGAVVGTTVSASSTMTASVGLLTARSGGTAVFALDASATGSTIAINASATGTPLGNANNFSGHLMVNDTAYDGALAEFLCGGGLTFKLAETIAVYSPTSGTASKVNVYYASNVITIQNNTANNRVFSVVAFRSRASA